MTNQQCPSHFTVKHNSSYSNFHFTLHFIVPPQVLCLSRSPFEYEVSWYEALLIFSYTCTPRVRVPSRHYGPIYLLTLSPLYALSFLSFSPNFLTFFLRHLSHSSLIRSLARPTPRATPTRPILRSIPPLSTCSTL